MRRLLSLGVVLAVSLLAGCQGEVTSSQGADVSGGKETFSKKCASCHTLVAANAQGQIGPNLDHAFGYAKGDGFEQSTIFEVTLQQMEQAIPPMPHFDDPSDQANYLTEEERVAVAAFVAQCASVAKSSDPACAGGGGTSSNDPQEIFSANCASCHTLAAANATGMVGPNLDDLQPTLQAAQEQITNGGGGMPAFADTLSAKQIEAVAKYVVDNAGK